MLDSAEELGNFNDHVIEKNRISFLKLPLQY